MNYYLTLAAFGLLAGCAIPLLRTGSGTVAVPLVYCSLVALHPAGSAPHRLSMHIAVATSCCVLAITAAAACRRHLQQADIDWRRQWRQSWPLCVYAASGALAGALSALACSPFRLRLLYVLYLAALITDCALRFDRLSRQSAAHAILAPKPPRRWPHSLGALALLAAGSLAAGAGVGGGAMTSPLIRRAGHAPAHAAALASMLAATAGAAAAAVYLGAAWRQGKMAGLGGWYAGYIDLSAVALLSMAGLLGMRLAAPFDGALPERLRVGAYMGLLLLVLFKMTT